MKHLVTLFALAMLAVMGYAQNPTWNLGGNTNVDSACFIGTTNNQPLQFKTNNQQQMVVTSDGKVGIGTVTPDKELTVVGNVQLQSLSGSGTRAVLADPNGNLIPAAFAPDPNGNDPNFCGTVLWSGAGNDIQSDCYIGTNNQQPFVIKTAGFEKIRVTTDGKVGLIQPNPLARLHIGLKQPLTFSQQTGTNVLGFNCYLNDQTGQLKQVGTGPSGMINFDDAKGQMHFRAQSDGGAGSTISPSQKGIFLQKSGFVGVGTDVPATLLDVNGDATIAQSLAVNGDATVSQTLTVNGFLESTGGARFDGQVCARRVTVHQGQGTCWPDYVFADDYKLRDLNEVEDFIETNGHLPGVPSASEVEEEGIDVAEMNRVLMEKVEELTLYLIEMKAENEEMKARLVKLEGDE